MKLYVSVDMEGITGVQSVRQVFPSSPEHWPYYHEATRWMEQDVLALLAPALENPEVSYILVNDSHAKMSNVKLANLAHPSGKLNLLSGKPKPVAMMAELDASFDAAFFVGYHAMAGTQNGVLCHTFHDAIAEVQVNGMALGEGGMNAAYAWLEHQIPVVLAMGDEAFCSEMAAFSSSIASVCSKQGLSFCTALHKPMATVHKELAEGMERFLQAGKATRFELPSALQPSAAGYTLQVRFIQTLHADIVSVLPGLQRLNGTTVMVQAETFKTAYLWLQSIYSLLSYEKAL